MQLSTNFEAEFYSRMNTVARYLNKFENKLKQLETDIEHRDLVIQNLNHKMMQLQKTTGETMRSMEETIDESMQSMRQSVDQSIDQSMQSMRQYIDESKQSMRQLMQSDRDNMVEYVGENIKKVNDTIQILQHELYIRDPVDSDESESENEE